MKSFRKELWFNLPARMELVNITREVQSCLAESGVREGLCLVNAMHITASSEGEADAILQETMVGPADEADGQLEEQLAAS
jgi:thiamine phosphate synthase YjbQ (UPF0047 family)